jgi:hypothetical protein
MQCYLKLANYHAPFGQASSIIYDRIVRGASAADVAIGTLEGAIDVPAPVTTPTTPSPPAAPPGTPGNLSVSGGIEASAYTISAGQSATFTAKVNGSSGTPTGTITFSDNGTTIAGCASLALSGGEASCSTSALAAGSHAIRAGYSGNATYGTGVMGPITATVNALAGVPVAAPTTYTLAASVAGNGSGTISSSPSGLSCSASCSASYAPGTMVTLNAMPSSTSTFTGWSGACSGTSACSVTLSDRRSVTATFTQRASGSRSVSGGIEPDAYAIGAGQSLTLTARLGGTGGTPTGTVSFRDNGNLIAGCSSVGLSGGTATCATTALASGSHAISGNYSGDASYGVGVVGPITVTVSSATAAAGSTYNVQGLWWQPSEPGWGVNLTQQGGVIFATWFTYDAQGKGTWLVMSRGERSGENAWSGALHRTSGPSYDATSYDVGKVQYAEAGTAYFSFSDDDNGTFVATVNGITITKSITRFKYAATLPTCAAGAPSGTNFQDLWWRSGGGESGWGVNITHQGDVLFATLFTYDRDGSPMWIEGSSLVRTSNGTYSGMIDRTTGPSFGQSFDASRVAREPLGTMTVSFSDAANGTLSYSVNGTQITKPVTRYVYATPATSCN